MSVIMEDKQSAVLRHIFPQSGKPKVVHSNGSSVIYKALLNNTLTISYNLQTIKTVLSESGTGKSSTLITCKVGFPNPEN